MSEEKEKEDGGGTLGEKSTKSFNKDGLNDSSGVSGAQKSTSSKVRTTFVFTGNLPKPNVSLRPIISQIKTNYIIEGGDFAVKHKMLILLSLAMLIVSMIPGINVLLIVVMFFLWPLFCAIAFAMLRNPPLEWFNKDALKMPENWDLKETVILGVSAIFGIIAASILMSIFMGLMVYVVMSAVGILSILLFVIALVGLFGSMLVLLPLFGCFVLAVPLVFFHKQSALDSLRLAYKAQKENIKATVIAYTGLSIVQGVLMLLSILFSLLFGWGGIFLIPLFAYFTVVQLDFYLWMYKHFLLEKRTVKIG